MLEEKLKRNRYWFVPAIGIPSTIGAAVLGEWLYISRAIQPVKAATAAGLATLVKFNSAWHTTTFNATGIDPSRDPYSIYYHDQHPHEFPLRYKLNTFLSCGQAFWDWSFVGGGNVVDYSANNYVSFSSIICKISEGAHQFPHFRDICLPIHAGFCDALKYNYTHPPLFHIS